jgi:hypothetical protein
MQPSKISSIFDALDMGDAKSAMKIYSKEIEKNLKKIKSDPAHKVAVDCMHAAILA